MLGWKDVSNYDFKVVTLFEAIQLEWLLKWKSHEVLNVLFKQYPEIAWFIKNKNPKLKEQVEQIQNIDSNLVYSIEIENKFISSLEDWIVYAIDPECYDNQNHNNWDSKELLDLVDFQGKTVIDVGSGTGKQVFLVAPMAKYVYSVEPVSNLRTYIKDKSKKLGYNHVYVVDGLLTDIPYPDNFTDVVMSGHVFGDDLEDEYNEMFRVVKPGGMIILIPGNNDEDNDIHKFLINKGFQYGTFLEPGDGYKRKYWLTK